MVRNLLPNKSSFLSRLQQGERTTPDNKLHGMLMTIESIGSSSCDSSWLKAFRAGSKTLSKDDLTELQSKLQTQGVNAASVLNNISGNFDTIDTNGNGISFDELKTYAKTQKSSLPKPPDGGPKSMSKDELSAMATEMSNSGDTEGAAAITKIVQNFDAADTDKDGEVSAEEAKSYAEQKGIEMPKPQGHGHRPPPMEGSEETDTDLAVDSSSSSDSESASAAENLMKLVLQKYGDAASSWQDIQSLLKEV